MDRRTFLFDWLSRGEEPEQGHELTIRIAGVTLSLSTSLKPVSRWIRAYFSDYVTVGPCRARVSIGTVTSDECQGVWEDDDPEFSVRGDSVVQRDFAARKLGGGSGEEPLRVVAAVSTEEPSDAILNLLRWLLPDLLLAESAFLLHAASVVRNGRAYVFFGQSGAGKSTAAELIAKSDPQALLHGDDAAIVRCVSDEVWLHATPLGAGFATTAPIPFRVPVSGLFALRQDSRNEIVTIPPARAVRTLLASAMAAELTRDQEPRFALAERMIRSRHGVRELHFTKDGTFWTMARAERARPREYDPIGRESHVE